MENTFEFVITSLIFIVSYFLRDIHASFKEYKKNAEIEKLKFIEEHGKLKGTIDMVKIQAMNDIKRIEEMTQLKLDQIGKDVSELKTDLHEYLKNNSSKN